MDYLTKLIELCRKNAGFTDEERQKFTELLEAGFIDTSVSYTHLKLYKDCEKILTEKAANVYIQDLANLVAIRDGYDGYVFYPLYVQDMSTIYKTSDN